MRNLYRLIPSAQPTQSEVNVVHETNLGDNISMRKIRTHADENITKKLKLKNVGKGGTR